MAWWLSALVAIPLVRRVDSCGLGRREVCDRRPGGRHAEALDDEVSLLQSGKDTKNGFSPSEEFMQATRKEASQPEAAQGVNLPYGVSSPPNTGNPVLNDPSWPIMDYPKSMEYSLDFGNTIRSYSWHKQDIKILTQLFVNVTNGFFLETNARDGEHGSNTLLFELLGWRGLVMEPRTYWYINMWSKFRKAWLFQGTISPNNEHTKVGFDMDGKVDMLSGHKIHTHPLKSFMEEMGGRTTVDFWSLNNGGFEPEVLNATLINSNKRITIGVICVTINHRLSGRGTEPWAAMRSKDEAEQLIYQIMHDAGWKALGGIDAQWVNTIVPRWTYNDAVFANPRYWDARELPMPNKIYSAPPPPIENPVTDHVSLLEEAATTEWNEGLTHEQETAILVEYIKKSRADAAPKDASEEFVPKAHRSEELTLAGANDVYFDPRHL